MAKSTKHQDAVKPIEEFRAPWETADGTEAEIDKPKLKRYIYGLVTDKAKAQDTREDALVDLTAAETERDEAKTQAADSNGAEAQKKIDALQKKVDDLTAENTGLVKAQELATLRGEVLGDLDPKYAKYVKGETKDELEKSLEEIKKDFGLDGESEEEEEEEEGEVRTQPRTRTLRNPADKESGKGSDEIDFDKVADEYLGSTVFR